MGKLRICSLFSGIGGFEKGIENAYGEENIEVVFSSEIDKFASQSYSIIHKHEPKGDITEIHERDIPDHDVLVAGFPCQAFSISGKRLGFQDETRGTLFFDVVRILKEKKSKFFVLENVPGLLNHDKGRTFNIILKTLDGLGYHVSYKLLNSKHYGLAQNRERVFIVGSLDQEFAFGFPNESSVETSLEDILCPHVEANYYISKKRTDRFQPRLSNSDIKVVGNISPSGYRGYNVNSVKGINPTLLARTNEYFVMLENGVIRKLTPLECFRLQGFPDEWYHTLQANGVSNAQCYKLAGNAVSINVIEALFKNLNLLEKTDRQKHLIY